MLKGMIDVNLLMHLLEIEITTRCNLNCLHCYNRENKYIDMEYENIIKYVNFANDNNVNTLVISGGEAALHKDFKKICEYFAKNRNKLSNIKKIIVQSNGYIKNINEKYLKGFDYIHLSFDIDKNGLREISSIDTINLARKLKRNSINTYLFTTIHKQNINYIDEIVQMANENNIDIAFNFCIDTGKNKQYLLTHKEKREAISKLLEYEKQGKINKLRNPYVNSLKKMELKEETFNIKGGCTAGIASCTILANGDVIPCPFLRKVAGNIYKQPLETIWFKSELFNILRDRQKYEICGKCKYLAYCGGCRKSAYESSGKINGYDKNCIEGDDIIERRVLANEY